jgi:hypothetical protein
MGARSSRMACVAALPTMGHIAVSGIVNSHYAITIQLGRIRTCWVGISDLTTRSHGSSGYEITYVENNPDTKPVSRVVRSAKRKVRYIPISVAEAEERRQRAVNIDAAKAIEKKEQ